MGFDFERMRSMMAGREGKVVNYEASGHIVSIMKQKETNAVLWH